MIAQILFFSKIIIYRTRYKDLTTKAYEPPILALRLSFAFRTTFGHDDTYVKCHQ